MGQIKVEKNVGGIEGLCVIEPAVHGDARGYFMETYNQRDMEEAGLDMVFVQDNQSCSTKGVLRGLHFQKEYPLTLLFSAVDDKDYTDMIRTILGRIRFRHVVVTQVGGYRKVPAEELAEKIRDGAMCGLGQTAPNPVLSTLRYFRDEYIAHIVDKKCPAGVCKDLVQYRIDPDKCKGCTLCARTCPADAIIGKVRETHMINPEKCLKCGACMEKCRFGAIYKK